MEKAVFFMVKTGPAKIVFATSCNDTLLPQDLSTSDAEDDNENDR